MKLIFLLFFLPILAWANITPDILSNNIKTLGAKQVVASFQQSDWDRLFSAVAEGEKEWLDVVPMLAPATDASHSARLEDALASALSTNTPEALKTLNLLDANKYPAMIGTDIVCVPPFERSKSDIIAFYKRTHNALLSTSEGATCLWILEASMDEWQRTQ